MFGYFFQPKIQKLEFEAHCNHCQNQFTAIYSLPKDIPVILRTGKISFDACSRCYDIKQENFKLGYQMTSVSNPDFKTRFHAWIKERELAGDHAEDDIVLE